MSLKKLLAWGTDRLKKAGVGDAAGDAWFLLEHVTGMSRAAYFAHPEQMASVTEQKKYKELIEKRAKRIPLQHILGEWEFLGETFYVGEEALVPRQETELLIEEVSRFVNESGEEPVRILDIGTGSGCIPIGIHLLTKEKRLLLEGVDLSEKALSLAVRNREKFHLSAEELKFYQSDVFSNVEGCFSVIVSNPPYISLEEWRDLEPEVREYDPKMALTDEGDGLFFYRKITKEAPEYLEDGGLLAFEIGADQGEAVMKMMVDSFTDVICKQDYAGKDRMVFGRKRAR